MQYIIIENGTPREITLRQLIEQVKSEGVSPPAWWQIASEEKKNATLAQYDVYPFVQNPRPPYDIETEKLEMGDFVQDGNGNWSRSWNVVPLTQQELDEKAAQEEEIKDQLVQQISNLPKEQQLPFLWKWQREKEANPSLTKSQFLAMVRADLDTLKTILG